MKKKIADSGNIKQKQKMLETFVRSVEGETVILVRLKLVRQLVS